MRWILILSALIVLHSCREIDPFGSLTAVNGYQLDGNVTTKDGRPIDSVDVWLNYTYSICQFTPLDTVRVLITDTARVMFVGVYTPDGRCVRKLYEGRFPAGLFPRYFWDERDDGGNYVPSGKYFLRYVYGTALVKEVPWLADGHRVAVTNVAGQFVLAGWTLPLDEIFDLYDYDSTYDATYRVQTTVYLRFTRGQLWGGADVPLTKDRITRGSYIVE